MSGPSPKIACLTGDVADDRRQTRSTLPGLDLLRCLLCQSEKRQQKNRRLLEKTVRCSLDCSAETLINAARIRQDDRVLLELDNVDVHAKDVLYHPTCYRNYTSPRQLDLLAKKELYKDDNTSEDSPYQRAFLKFANEVEEKLLGDSTTIVSLSDLCTSYKAFLQEERLMSQNYRSHLLKARLLSHFGSRLTFHRPQKQNAAQYVFSSATHPGPLIESCLRKVSGCEREDCEEDVCAHNIWQDMPVIDPASDTANVYAVAKMLRRDLLALQNKIPFPPEPSHISDNKIDLPNSLYNFLCWVIEGDNSSESLSLETRVNPTTTATHRRVLSIGQDVVYCASRGQVKTPKHIALRLTLKHITGSTQAVTLLNRFGHGMSESQLLECETAMAERQIQQQNAGVAIVPSNIRSSGFVTFCWDNNGINEETPSGSGTTHCTNGIVVQRQCPSTAACAEYVSGTMYCVPNRHRRSFNPLADPQIEYNAGRRQASLPISVLNEQLTVKTGILPVDADFAWILTRLLQVDSQNVGQISERQQTPGWSGFNSLLHRHDEIRYSAIGYLPIIPTSPTQLSTVYLLLQRSIAVADELKQESVVIVCDQAIYSKAQEIVCKHRDQFSRVVLRMGGFHIALTFLAVIGKRFGDAGLSDIMVESGIVGTAAVNSVIAGKQYNRSVRSHKIVLEALNRILWREFEGWLVEQPDMEDIVTENLTSSLASFRQANYTSECFRIMTELPTFKSLLEKFRQFCSSLESPTAKFWLSYTQSVWLLLNFIRSMRTSVIQYQELYAPASTVDAMPT